MEYKNLNQIPMYPEYAYDDAEEIDRDVEYMKGMYPQAVRAIQHEVDEECDKLEYEGSCMFDEFPCSEHLGIIVDAICDRIMSSNMEGMELSAEQYRSPMGPFPGRPPHRPRPDFRPDGSPDWMRGLVSSLLFNEMLHRRRRFRRRRRPYHRY